MCLFWYIWIEIHWEGYWLWSYCLNEGIHSALAEAHPCYLAIGISHISSRVESPYWPSATKLWMYLAWAFLRSLSVCFFQARPCLNLYQYVSSRGGGMHQLECTWNGPGLHTQLPRPYVRETAPAYIHNCPDLMYVKRPRPTYTIATPPSTPSTTPSTRPHGTTHHTLHRAQRSPQG